MLMIRLQRVGKKHDPSFRVLLTDSKNSTKSGKFIEVLGHYDARGGKAELKKDRIKHWLSVGAKTSITLHNILKNNKKTLQYTQEIPATTGCSVHSLVAA